MTKIIDFKGLEGMLAFYEGKIGVVSNNYQFIAYNSFNSKFSDQLDRFSREYAQSPDSFRLGLFNSDSYQHLEKINWKEPNLILTDNVFKKLKDLETKLPAEIKAMNRFPFEKCMSSYMGMRLLSIFGNKVRYYPVLAIDDGKPIVINFNTITSKSDFEKEVKCLIVTSPLFLECKSEEFKMEVLNYYFDDINFDDLVNYDPR